MNILWNLGLKRANLHQHLPGYRSRFEIEINKRFFEPLETCPQILAMLKNGFTAD